MVELVDTLGLGPSAFGRGGSSPSMGTNGFGSRFPLKSLPHGVVAQLARAPALHAGG